MGLCYQKFIDSWPKEGSIACNCPTRERTHEAIWRDPRHGSSSLVRMLENAKRGYCRGRTMSAGNYFEEEAGHGRVYSVRRV
jgi:hypothetical protein